MKYSGGGDTDTMLLWGGAADIGGGVGDHFLLDNKLDMDSTTDDDTSTKATMDALDSLLLTCTQSSPPCSSNSNLAELKPLPPFTGYTGHLSINGIPGHHYHAIAAAPQSPPSPHPASETNNNTQVTNNNLVCKTTNTSGATLYYTVTTDQPIVSSSTVDGIKSEYVDYSHLMAPDIEDIAALIGSAIAADTTVPQVVDGLSGEDPSGSRDSWMDLGAWIDNACGSGDSVCQGGGKAIISAESLQEFVANSQFVVSTSPEPNVGTSTLQSLLAQNHHQQQQQNNFHQPMQQILKRENSSNNNHSYNTQQSQMSLLQSRLQNGPSTMSNGGIKPEPSYMSDCPSPSSSTSYLNSSGELIIPHTTTGSPPGHVVSTTDNTLLINGRYGVHQRSNRPNYGHMRGMKGSGMPSPDLLINGSSLDGLVSGMHGNYPHTTTATTTTPNKNKNRNRNRKQQQQQQQGIMYAADGSGGLLGKEKPVHRCTICNRGFLNKSNIKVHLRTHTGEKPFRCEVCGKAFRQKAHLIKHQQIHKRIGRD